MDPVVVGQVLLAGCWLAVLCFAPALGPGAAVWATVAATGVLTLVVLIVSIRVPWASLPSGLTIVFPLAVCLSLAALGAAQRGFSAPLSGLLTLCYAYLGLTRPPGTALFAMPIGAVTLFSCYGVVSSALTVRLVIAVFVWTVLAELLARLTRRQTLLATSLVGEALGDELTGLPNRRDFDRRITTVVPGTSLVMCDIDRFKYINDSQGHAVGDRVLADFGAILRLMVRGGDYCARYGGEEFVLILPDTTAGQARALLGRLQEQWATLQPTVTFSAGVATCSVDRLVSDTLAVADAMLYSAKAAGRNRIATENALDPVA